MDREMHQQLQEAEASQPQSSTQSQEGVNFRPGEPMVNVGR
jgi:hypothetical protein